MYVIEESGSKRTKISQTSYITSPDAHFEFDMNREGELELNEVVHLVGQDKEKRIEFSSNASGVKRGFDVHRDGNEGGEYMGPQSLYPISKFSFKSPSPSPS